MKERGAELGDSMRQAVSRKTEVEQGIEIAQGRYERADADCRGQRAVADSQGVNLEITDKELELQALKNANAGFKVALSKLMHEPPYAEQLNPLFQSLLQERQINWNLG